MNNNLQNKYKTQSHMTVNNWLNHVNYQRQNKIRTKILVALLIRHQT